MNVSPTRIIFLIFILSPLPVERDLLSAQQVVRILPFLYHHTRCHMSVEDLLLPFEIVSMIPIILQQRTYL